MTILVDAAVWPWRGRRWAHLVSDSSLDELHRFAEWLGVDDRLFQGDHYDIPDEFRDRALELGAESVDSRELVRRLRASGLRLSPAERRQLPRKVPAGRRVEGVVGSVGDVEPSATGEAAEHG